MTYEMTLFNGRKIDIACPFCDSDELRSQGPRKNKQYHMFQCKKCGKCHSRFLDSGKIVIRNKEKWEYGFQMPTKDECIYLTSKKSGDEDLIVSIEKKENKI